MGDTVILTVYFPLIIGGMVLVIMWGMSAAGSGRTGLPGEGNLGRAEVREVSHRHGST